MTSNVVAAEVQLGTQGVGGPLKLLAIGMIWLVLWIANEYCHDKFGRSLFTVVMMSIKFLLAWAVVKKAAEAAELVKAHQGR